MVVSGLEYAKSIAEVGILVVIAGTFISATVWLIKFFAKTIKKTNNESVELNKNILGMIEVVNTSQNALILQVSAFRDTLDKLAEVELQETLLEQTKENAFSLIYVSFYENLYNLISGAEDIILKNHISDKDGTRNKILNIVTTSHKKRLLWLNKYTYKSVKLGTYADKAEWIDRKIEILSSHIYSEEKNPNKLVRDLKEAYDSFRWELSL